VRSIGIKGFSKLRFSYRYSCSTRVAHVPGETFERRVSWIVIARNGHGREWPYRGSIVTSRQEWPAPGWLPAWSRRRSKTWPRSGRMGCTCGTSDNPVSGADWRRSVCTWSFQSSIRSCSRSCSCWICRVAAALSSGSPRGEPSCSRGISSLALCARLERKGEVWKRKQINK